MNVMRFRPGVLTFLRWEWTLQARTLRFRLSLALYLLLVPAAALVLLLAGERLFGAVPGPVSYLAWTLQIQVLLSVLLGCAWAGNRSGGAARDEMWPVLSASPLSNAGYGLRRTAALALLLLPATALGIVGAASMAVAAGEPPTSPTRWLVTWLLLIYLPAAVSASAWLTLVSASGSEMVAAILALVLLRLGSAAADLGSRSWGRPLGLDAEMFGFAGFWWANLLGRALARGRGWFGGIASEAPIDMAAFLSRWWLSAGVSLGLTAAVGLLMPLWLGRTKRDLPPLRLPEDHWLRTLGPKVYSAFQRLVPDAGLRELRWLPFLALLPVMVSLVDDWRRGTWALDLAQRRFEAELAGAELAPTDTDLLVTSWRSEGTVSPQGVDLVWRAEFLVGDIGVTRGDIGHLAFTLDPFLEITELEITALEITDQDGALLTNMNPRRLWDRWSVDFEPRPRPGCRIQLSARLRGRPGAFQFDLERRYRVESFATAFEDYREHGYAWRHSDPADSRFLPAVSARGVDLPARSLGPVPRYSSWELTPPPVTQRDPGWEVPEEASSVAADVQLDLTFQTDKVLDAWIGFGGPDLTVASSCGGLSSGVQTSGALSSGGGLSRQGRTRLVDSCRVPMHDLRVVGARWLILGEPPVMAAALPRHRDKLEAMLPEMRQTVRVSSEAWPGYEGIERLAVVEESARPDISGRSMLRLRLDWDRANTFGRLVSFQEHQLLAEGILDPSALLDSILGTEVASGRRLDPDQRYALRSFLAALMKRRMGVATPSAVLGQGMPPWNVDQLTLPILKLRHVHGVALAYKVPAVVLQLEGRLGMDMLVAAVADFLARETDDPATFEELFEFLESHSGEDLSGFYRDYFVNGALPELSLVDTRSKAHRGGWQVTGAVANSAAGTVHCPVVLRTDGLELRRTAVVPAEGRVEFSFDVEARPQVVLLDPDGQCLRLFGGRGVGAERASL